VVDARVPDASTLMKLTTRPGPELFEELNAELLSLAVERKVLRSRRLRVDTTVVGSDTRYPTDSGLCAHAVWRLIRLRRRVKAAGFAPRTKLRDRRRSVGKRVRRISATLARGGGSGPVIDRLAAEIARTHDVWRAAPGRWERATGAPHWSRRRAGRAARVRARRGRAGARANRAWARWRAGDSRSARFADRSGRPIRRGNPCEPTEFGDKARVADTAEGFVIVDIPERGNPADETLLEGAIVKAKQAGMQLRLVHADRGFGKGAADEAPPGSGSATRSFPASTTGTDRTHPARGSAATAIGTESRDASPSSSARGLPAHACEGLPVRAPGSAESHSPTTSTSSRPSPNERPTAPTERNGCNQGVPPLRSRANGG
jgi:IS5 family transposase